MSNPILQSNQSSAVVATVNESQTMSPWVYNETNRLVVPHAMQVLPINHSSGTVGASKTISFDIAKNGLVQGLWLKVSMPVDTTDTETDNPLQTETGGVLDQDAAGVNAKGYTSLGLLKIIQEVRLTTSGRIVESLDRYQILARIADMPLGQRQAVLEAYRCNADPDKGASGNYEACLWLPFYFSKDPSRYHINSNFAEPFQVQVSFSDCTRVLHTGSAFETAANHAPQDCDLLVHYRQLDEKSINEVISKNYGDGLLSQIVHISKKEATKSYSVAATGITALNQKNTKAQDVEFELKENDAIQSMYIVVEHQFATTTSFPVAIKDEAPLEIMEVELKFNNTSVVKVPGTFLKHFGRWGNHGMCGDGSDSARGNSPTQYVYKLDFGLDYAKGAFSNVVALREISNPKLLIKFKPYIASESGTSPSYNVHVIYDTATFLSTSSATGRVNLSISS